MWSISRCAGIVRRWRVRAVAEIVCSESDTFPLLSRTLVDIFQKSLLHVFFWEIV
jgi:hypothetical protein